MESTHDNSNDDEIITVATPPNSAECGTAVTVNMPGDVTSDEDHSNAIPQSLHQRYSSDTVKCITAFSTFCQDLSFPQVL